MSRGLIRLLSSGLGTSEEIEPLSGFGEIFKKADIMPLVDCIGIGLYMDFGKQKSGNYQSCRHHSKSHVSVHDTQTTIP